MNRYKFWYPSTLTLLNLALGFVAILLNHPVYSLSLILIGCFLDVFDGILARLLKATSDFGKELDSLADIVTFGVAPAYLVYSHCLEHTVPNLLLVTLLPVFSAIRLAKFNNDASQHSNFAGLPTPVNGLFFASMPYLFQTTGITESYLVPFILLFCILMVSPLRMFAYKDVGKGGPDTVFPILFLVIVLFASFFLSLSVIPVGVLVYIILSVGYHFFVHRTTKNSV
jgi:CDP-diacylglycerol---serine O-phosphatidyltransferase